METSLLCNFKDVHLNAPGHFYARHCESLHFESECPAEKNEVFNNQMRIDSGTTVPAEIIQEVLNSLRVRRMTIIRIIRLKIKIAILLSFLALCFLDFIIRIY
jgi:hypothetical protein